LHSDIFAGLHYQSFAGPGFRRGSRTEFFGGFGTEVYTVAEFLEREMRDQRNQVVVIVGNMGDRRQLAIALKILTLDLVRFSFFLN